MPDAGQIFRVHATDADRARLDRIAGSLGVADVIAPPDRAGPRLTCLIRELDRQRLVAVADELSILGGAAGRMAMALGIEALERAVEEAR